MDAFNYWFATGGMVFVAILLMSAHALIEPVGFAFGLWLCFWASPFRETIFVWHATRRIETEHEQL